MTDGFPTGRRRLARVGTRLAVGLAALALCAGCNVYHLRKNAPGELPRDSERVESARTGDRVRPEDPGERAVEGLVGPTLEFGGPLDSRRSVLGHSLRLGGELTLHYLVLDESHSVSNVPFASEFAAIRSTFHEVHPMRVAPRLNLGSAYRLGANAPLFYGEAGVAYPGKIGMTAGYQWSPRSRSSGIRGTLTLWGLFRVQYVAHPRGSDQIFAGISLRSGHTVVWSR